MYYIVLYYIIYYILNIYIYIYCILYYILYFILYYTIFYYIILYYIYAYYLYFMYIHIYIYKYTTTISRLVLLLYLHTFPLESQAAPPSSHLMVRSWTEEVCVEEIGPWSSASTEKNSKVWGQNWVLGVAFISHLSPSMIISYHFVFCFPKVAVEWHSTNQPSSRKRTSMVIYGLGGWRIMRMAITMKRHAHFSCRISQRYSSGICPSDPKCPHDGLNKQQIK